MVDYRFHGIRMNCLLYDIEIWNYRSSFSLKSLSYLIYGLMEWCLILKINKLTETID